MIRDSEWGQEERKINQMQEKSWRRINLQSGRSSSGVTSWVHIPTASGHEFVMHLDTEKPIRKSLRNDFRMIDRKNKPKGVGKSWVKFKQKFFDEKKGVFVALRGKKGRRVS